MEPVNVDGVRRFINASPEDLSDDEIRLAQMRMDLAAQEAMSAHEHEQRIRRFAAAMERVRIIGRSDTD